MLFRLLRPTLLLTAAAASLLATGLATRARAQDARPPQVALAPPTVDATPQPYEAVRFNALKHGILSRYTVLSHESHADYESLVNSLMDEHIPAGATEQHLIEELASVIWRKRRVLQAEGATINKGLKESARSAKTVIPAAAPFEMGLSGEGTDIRNLMDLKPEDVTEAQAIELIDARAAKGPPKKKGRKAPAKKAPAKKKAAPKKAKAS